VPDLVRMQGIVKRFGDVTANDAVDFELAPGEIHALLGENGAGKTTLMNVLYGLSQPDEGVIELNGQPIRPRGPADAIEAGIGMVHQHPLLVGPLTVADNMRLGGVGDGTAKGTLAALARYTEGFPLRSSPDDRVADLPMSERQRLEIVRCLCRGVRVLILDEPTALLTPGEAVTLFAELRRLAEDGHGVVFITHKLSEVVAIADRVTILRRGRNIGTFAAREATPRELAARMVGATLTASRLEAVAETGRARPRGPGYLRLDAATVEDAFGHVLLDAVSLGVRRGEIVCLAGVEGNGQQALAQLLFGLRPPSSGRVLLDAADLPEAREWGSRGILVGRIPEDRRQTGLLLDAPLWRNLTLGPMGYRPGRLLRRGQVLEWTRAVLTDYGVMPPDPLAPAGSLSGGNQQKVVLARELWRGPKAIVALNPTRGLDVNAQLGVHDRLRRLRDQGSAVLVVSTDLDEVTALADRIGVLYRGRLHGPYEAGSVDHGQLGELMAGVAEASESCAPSLVELA
jgi:general nucleoside transport system ATP-binding protein